jgi:hemolysin III
MKERKINNPQRGVLEEIGNAITHGIGALLSILGMILMILKSNNNIEMISSIIYCSGLFILFTMSCLYHSFKNNSKVKQLFRRFDHLSIYILIVSTFVPILLVFIGGVKGIIFGACQWIIAILGIVFIAVFGVNKFKKMHMTFYLLLGWSGIMLLPAMIKEQIYFAYYILGGGIIYTLGIIPFMIKGKCARFIWHFFVLLGAAIQWVGIFLYAI